MISSDLINKKIEIMTEFEKYLKEARQRFCKEVNKYDVSDNLQLRTEIDSLLIAFDQATEKAINYTRCCETLKDKYEIVFEDWLKDHIEQSNNGFCKNGIDYKVNEITWMYIQDVYNL
jgi:hypothetical protein